MKIKKYGTENVPVRLVTKMFAVEVIFSLEKIKPNNNPKYIGLIVGVFISC